MRPDDLFVDGGANIGLFTLVAATAVGASREVVGAQRDRLALVRLDLEGAEQAALVGARAILDDGRADFLVEVEPGHLARQGATPHGVVTLLRTHGYRFYQAMWNSEGRVELRRDASPELRGAAPNLFATRTAARAHRQGSI